MIKTTNVTLTVFNGKCTTVNAFKEERIYQALNVRDYKKNAKHTIQQKQKAGINTILAYK